MQRNKDVIERHLQLQDVRVGDWVQEYSEITDKLSIPMYVSAIFENGDVYLDFNGNEADVWEEEIENIVPIQIDEDILKGFGFEHDKDIGDFFLRVGDRKLYVHRFQYDLSMWVIQFDDDVRYTPTCRNIHELQHIFYKYTRKPLILGWRGF